MNKTEYKWEKSIIVVLFPTKKGNLHAVLLEKLIVAYKVLNGYIYSPVTV